MKCFICGRKLRNPQSKEIGYGPVCYKRIFGKAMTKEEKGKPYKNTYDIPYYDIPGQMTLSDYLQSED